MPGVQLQIIPSPKTLEQLQQLELLLAFDDVVDMSPERKR
jgi:hypothetical protein